MEFPRDRVARFFARLIQSRDVSELNESELLELLVDVDPWITKSRETDPDLQGEILPDMTGMGPVDRVLIQMEPEIGRHPPAWEREIRLHILEELQRDAQRLIFGMLDGQRVSVRVSLSLTLKHRVPIESFEVLKYNPLEYGLTTLLRESPFPFARCRRCQTTFVQLKMGKPRIYCSESCKSKGVPSSKNRPKYARSYRQRRRAEELKAAIEVLKKAPRETASTLLGKAFPGKSARQIVYLRKSAERQLRGDRLPLKRRSARSRQALTKV